MEGLMQLFDRKYREYQDYLDEKSWADAALAQSYLLGIYVEYHKKCWEIFPA